jgi:superfamily I DNA and/or RNA helicase
VRELLDRAGLSIQQMKPCFMMSPLSVAQFLKPNRLRFDLVLIDEASQMRPEEALGALARGGQLVVVGDPMQLPPTSFFDRGDRMMEDEIDEEEIVDNESILDLALAEFRPSRSLRWHYRSRHESLIAFSNRQSTTI